MSFFRNQEIRKQIIISLLLLIFTGGIGFYLFPDNRAGIAYAFWCCLAMCLLWLIFTKMRYSHLKNLAADADRMLHGERNLNFTSYQEGELAILANEVEKLLWRLTEQSDNLLKEKRYLSDSLADISHQLRTPLTSLHLLLTRLQEAEDEREKRRLAYEGAQLLGRVDWLVNALLKISKIDAGTAVFAKERVDAEALVEKALKPLSIPMELREQAVVREMEDRAGFTGDAAWTVEALGNILKNCMEHTGQGGTLWIRASENYLYTEFQIEDNGSGIDPEDLPHLFERFYKGKNASDSSVGIGLALSRMIVCAQNGTLKAENRAEGGARFTMRFYKGVV
ncbi:MAG: HAMP domain-containing histidine kinase [Lachnospiraceae bacterium]|jgi:signal transduction histidine kinase|nr:HAMP domain-containing histidine kinase [Lachnospiraceae bacterium]MCI9682800.1 HAMP domain-containing histidine kinase [Lachnospiraceae bacterium]